jgi:hypothetical protein
VGRGISWLEVRDRTDRWGPPISKKKKRNGKEEREGVLRASVCSAGLGLLPRVGPVGCCLFFCSFLFYFFFETVKTVRQKPHSILLTHQSKIITGEERDRGRRNLPMYKGYIQN